MINHSTSAGPGVAKLNSKSNNQPTEVNSKLIVMESTKDVALS